MDCFPIHVCGQTYDQRLVIQDARDGSIVYERILKGGATAELGEAAVIYGVVLSLTPA